MNSPTSLLFTDLGGDVKQIARSIDPDNKMWSAFNPSIAYSPSDGLAMLIRSSNYMYTKNGSIVLTEGGTIRNRMYFCKIFDDYTVGEFSLINFFGFNFPITRGVEDGKLYWRDGSWQFTGVVKESYGVPIPRMATFNLEKHNAILVEVHDRPWMAGTTEKNWMAPYNKNKNFDFIYSSTSIYKDGNLIKLRDVPIEYKNLRGTSNLWELPDKTYLAICHITKFKKNEYYDPSRFGVVTSDIRDYDHMFTQYDEYGKLIKISKNFKFLKPGIEFASGLIVKDNKIIVSFGRADISSHLATIDLDTVLGMLEEV